MFTPDEKIKLQIGDLVVQLAYLQSENEMLKAKLEEKEKVPVQPPALDPSETATMKKSNGSDRVRRI